MSISCNLCHSFNISGISFCKNKNSSNSDDEDEIEFDLVREGRKKFEDLLPHDENYLYLKVLKSEEIIAVSGSSLREIPLEKNFLIYKLLSQVDIYKILFIDYIKPLFDCAIEKGEAYQFTFKTNRSERKIVCSIYPCSLPGKISSVDIVLRYAKKTISDVRPSEFLVKRNSDSSGEKVGILE